MDKLTGQIITYKSIDTAGINDRRERVDIKTAIKLLNREIAPEVIKLKVRDIPVYRNSSTNFLPSRSVARLCSSRYGTPQVGNCPV